MTILATTLILAMNSATSFSQGLTFDDFIGTWNGTISSQSFGGYNDPITMTIEANGFYTETSGHLMPTLYPNTQQCEYQASTNRMHWWYLGTVWGGQYFYDHHYYEVVYFQNDTLEMHYNFWDDPEPHPEVGTIFMVKETLTPPPSSLSSTILDNNVLLAWEEPSNGGNPMAQLQGYNLYSRYESGSFEFLDYTEQVVYLIEDGSTAGMHTFYVTAVYDEGESNPSNQVSVLFTTPEPTSLQGEAVGNSVDLSWTEPSAGSAARATLTGYNVFHKFEDGPFEMIDFVGTTAYTHENLSDYGTHTYYITAVYDGGESLPSNEVNVDLVISGISDVFSIRTEIYPNPVSDVLYIRSEYIIETVKMYDQAGNILSEKPVSDKEHQVNVSDLSPGMYLIRMETEQAIISKRFLVK